MSIEQVVSMINRMNLSEDQPPKTSKEELIHAVITVLEEEKSKTLESFAMFRKYMTFSERRHSEDRYEISMLRRDIEKGGAK